MKFQKLFSIIQMEFYFNKNIIIQPKVVNNSHNSIPAQNYIHEICQRLDKNSLEMLKTVSFFNILEEPMNYSLFRGININFFKK